VQVREDKLLDYTGRYPNGEEEGNERGRIIDRVQRRVERNE
jgi:hypothetical protein